MLMFMFMFISIWIPNEIHTKKSKIHSLKILFHVFDPIAHTKIEKEKKRERERDRAREALKRMI